MTTCGYALVSEPEFCHGSSSNPVICSDVDQVKQNGLDIEALVFSSMLFGDNEEHRRTMRA